MVNAAIQADVPDVDPEAPGAAATIQDPDRESSTRDHSSVDDQAARLPATEPKRGKESVVPANRSESMFELLPGAIVVLDECGLIQDCNQKAQHLLGLPLIGCAWSVVVRREHCPEECRDGVLKLRDGRCVELTRQTLGTSGNEILLLVDVTESRRTAQLQSRFERLSTIGEMTSKLGHQIRTPLSAAMLYTDKLDKNGSDERHLAARYIRQSLTELSVIVDDMLQFVSGAKRAGDQFDAGELLRDVVRSAAPLLRPGAQIRIEVGTGNMDLIGNRDALKGAMLNLVCNAAQVCVGSPVIELSALSVGSDVWLSVKDNGPGVDAAIQSRVFEPFFTTRPQGTGLGLAVVRSVAEAHDGEVLLSNGSPGAIFSLRIPALSHFRNTEVRCVDE